jgi:aspartate/methionine/tyrosine aminotransferase
MQIQDFKLERFFAEYEFKAHYLLSPSDCEALGQSELLEMADAKSLALWRELRLGYTESQGHPLLRQEIAWLYEVIQPEQVIVAAPEEAIFIAMHTLLRPGDQVVTLFPAYQSLYEIARASGAQVLPWSFQATPSGWRLDLKQLEILISPKTRLLVINFPHNPTGYLPERAEWQAIIDLARRYGVYIFSDEMYRLLEYDPAERLPAVCDVYERGVSLSGLSKSMALPGLRIGWLATQAPELIQSWLAFKDYTTICNSAPGEILAIAALRARQAILERNLGIIQTNLGQALAFFDRHAGLFEWLAPRAGSVAFPRWRGPGKVEPFCQDLLEQRSVMIVPGSIFDFPGGYFRVGLGRINFPEALAEVEKGITDQKITTDNADF